MANPVSNPDHDVEQWRPIPGWEGWYSVSSWGRVRTETRTIIRRDGRPQSLKSKIVKQSKSAAGYWQFHMRRPGAQKLVRVSRMVLVAFKGDRPNLECRHMNGVKTDNRLENLEYGTRVDNVNDGHRHGLWERQRHAAVLNVDQVRAIAASREPRKVLMARYGISYNTVDRIRRGLTWKPGTEGVRTYL